MSTIKDAAVVLRKLDFSETSQVLALFTRAHGKVRIIAKGVKRSTKTRFAAAIDLLDVGHAVLSVRGLRQESLAILSEWVQTAASGALRTKLDRLYGAQYAAALTADLTEDWDPHPRLFEALTGLLTALATSEAALLEVVAFQRVLLEEIGSVPISEACVGCGCDMPTPGDIYFTALEGGLLCRDCEPARSEKRLAPPAALLWLRGERGAPAGAAPAFKLFDYHLAHLLGREHPLGALFLSVC